MTPSQCGDQASVRCLSDFSRWFAPCEPKLEIRFTLNTALQACTNVRPAHQSVGTTLPTPQSIAAAAVAVTATLHRLHQRTRWLDDKQRQDVRQLDVDDYQPMQLYRIVA